MSILIIYNPAAGRKNKVRLKALQNALQQHGLKADTYATEQAGDATDFLRNQTNPPEIVLVVGGDGTVREVINGIHKDCKLAVFATGTANVMSYELNLPHSAHKMVELIKHKHSVPIQFGIANTQRFCMWVGLGFDAWVVDQVNLNAKRKVGKLAYVASMLVQAFRYGRYRYRIQVDGQEYHSYSAVITHAKHYGGSFVLSQKAHLLTPKLQVLLFQKPGRGFFFKALFAMLFGRMEKVQGVVSLPFTQLHAELLDAPNNAEEKRLAGVLQADGDIFGHMPLQITLDSQSIEVLINPKDT